MKRLTNLLMMLIIICTVKAQSRIIDMNRTFSVTETLTKYCTTESFDQLKGVKPGVKWHLENEPLTDGTNYVRFWIELPDGTTTDDKKWRGKDIRVTLLVTEEGKKFYAVKDDEFDHLNIMQLDEGYLVHNCSRLQKK